MELKKGYIVGIVAGILVIATALLFFRGSPLFSFILGLGFIIGALPLVVYSVLENNKEKENNEMFLEFSRNLSESVKAGTPISRSILNLRNKNYGSLTRHIEKLANQISLGIPVTEAFQIFARDVNSRGVRRAVTLIIEAEKAGGEIESILESVAESVAEVEKLKKERQSAVYSLVVQGYIIFFIFIVIMIIMQFKILPMTYQLSSSTAGLQDLTGTGLNVSSNSQADVSQPLIYLLLVQGFFTGLLVGKLAEGNFKFGIKHSFIMVALALLIYTGMKAFYLT